MKKIKRLVTLWCLPRISNSLLVPVLKQTLFPFQHERTLLYRHRHSIQQKAGNNLEDRICIASARLRLSRLNTHLDFTVFAPVLGGISSQVSLFGCCKSSSIAFFHSMLFRLPIALWWSAGTYGLSFPRGFTGANNPVSPGEYRSRGLIFELNDGVHNDM